MIDMPMPNMLTKMLLSTLNLLNYHTKESST
jgi:hypothetical protein